MPRKNPAPVTLSIPSVPMSITVQEAIAAIIGWPVLVEDESLEWTLCSLKEHLYEHLFQLQGTGAPAEVIKHQQEIADDMYRLYRRMLDVQTQIIKELEKSNPALEVIRTMTASTRLNTQSVIAWAEINLDVKLPMWEISGVGIEHSKPQKTLSESEFEFVLFICTASLLHQLLCNDWPGWRLGAPAVARPTNYKYFENNAPVVDRIANHIITAESLSEDVSTISRHISALIGYLRGVKPAKIPQGKATKSVGRMLVSLWSILDKDKVCSIPWQNSTDQAGTNAQRETLFLRQLKHAGKIIDPTVTLQTLRQRGSGFLQ